MKPKVIVSLTSHTKERLTNVPYFLYHSILKHNFDFVKVVLTLAKEDVKHIDQKLQLFIDNGLVELIVADQDLKCHLKYFYAMKRYRDLPVITIDDDSIYPARMIPDFLTNAEKYPNVIIARSSHVITDLNKSYIHTPEVNCGLIGIKWNDFYDQVRNDLSLEGYGGIYYPADILRVSDDMIPEILEFPRADDIYLNIIENRLRISRVVPKYEYNKLDMCTKGFDAISTKPDNVKMIDALLQKYRKEFDNV